MTDSPPDSRQVIVVMDSFKSKIIRLRVRSAAFHVALFLHCDVYPIVSHPSIPMKYFLEKIHKNEWQWSIDLLQEVHPKNPGELGR